MVSSLQDEPRSTHDIDMVIMLEKQTVKPLSQAFSIDLFYIDEESVLDAVERKSMFNLTDGSSGNKVNFWLLTDEPLDTSRFTRRQRVEALGITNFYTTTPEDTILSKLRWAKLVAKSS